MALFKMNAEYLLKTEAETFAKTTSHLAGLDRELPHILDTFFLLMYSTGELDKKDKDRWNFSTLAWNTYLEVPYTIRCIYLNTTHGYYGQALMLLRHLLESLVKVEYAQKNKGLSERIWHAPGDGAGTVKRLSVSSIFSGVGKKELYASTYGILSAMTHGGATISMFRLERDGGEVKRVRQAMAYSEFYLVLRPALKPLMDQRVSHKLIE